MREQWRPEAMARPRARLPPHHVLWLLILLALLTFAFAQDEGDVPDGDANPEAEATPTTTTTTTSSSSSSSSSLSSILITSLPSASTSFSLPRSSSSSLSPTTTKSAFEIAPTVLLTDENTTYKFTLNRTSPVFLARFAHNITDRALGIILNIGELSQNTSEPLPKVIVTTEDNYLPNDRARSRISGGNAGNGYNIGEEGQGSWQVAWDNGFGNWTYRINNEWKVVNHSAVAPTLLIGRGVNDDIILDPGVVGGGNVTVFLGYTVLDTLPGEHFDYTRVGGIDAVHPYFGDSTASEALVFSPLRLSDPFSEPKYPNYTLPGPELPLPVWDTILRGEDASANSTFLFGGRARSVSFVVLPTSATPSDLGNSAAAIRAHAAKLPAADTPTVAQNGSVWTTVAGEAGFRDYALVGNLKPSTNYTVWAVGEDGITMSQPSWFTTKAEGFRCPILLPTSMCPGVAYASPLSESSAPLTAIPEQFAQFITSSLQAFEVSVLSGACGRDRYSHVSSCADCYAAYREWVCRLVLPQCAGPEVAFDGVDPNGPQVPFRVDRPLTAPRNGNVSSPEAFPAYPIDYTELQPCINTCTNVDRKCPSSLQWNCPHRLFNANESYAFYTQSNDRGDGSGRWPSTDVYGNRWCNGL